MTVVTAEPSTACAQPTPAAERGRIAGLDALRGVAALGVVAYHYTQRYDNLFGHTSHVPRFAVGAHGVLLFFIISGFVILMTVEKAKSPRHFVQSRFARLYPAFWACLPISFLVVRWSGVPLPTVSPRDFLVNLTMIPRPLGVREVDGVYWTLLVEMLFYALMFGGLLLGWVRHISIALTVLVGLAALDNALSLRARLPVTGPILTLASYAYCFLIGVTLFRVWQDRRWSPASVLYLLAALAFAVLDQGWLVATLVGFFAAVVYLATHNRLPFLATTPLLFLGTISYTLYLLHQNIGYVVIRQLESRGVNAYAAIGGAIGVSIGLATIISYTIERPVHRALRPRR